MQPVRGTPHSDRTDSRECLDRYALRQACRTRFAAFAVCAGVRLTLSKVQDVSDKYTCATPDAHANRVAQPTRRDSRFLHDATLTARMCPKPHHLPCIKHPPSWASIPSAVRLYASRAYNKRPHALISPPQTLHTHALANASFEIH